MDDGCTYTLYAAKIIYILMDKTLYRNDVAMHVHI